MAFEMTDKCTTCGKDIPYPFSSMKFLSPYFCLPQKGETASRCYLRWLIKYMKATKFGR